MGVYLHFADYLGLEVSLEKEAVNENKNEKYIEVSLTAKVSGLIDKVT